MFLRLGYLKTLQVLKQNISAIKKPHYDISMTKSRNAVLNIP